MKIPFFDYTRQYQDLIPELTSNFLKTINEGNFINGESVKIFEENFRRFVEAKYCVAVSSGTDALTSAIMVSKKKSKKKVALCTSFTFVASAMTAMRENYKIRFVDVEKNQFKPSVSDVIKSVCDNTSLIIWPHLFGEPTDLAELRYFCDKKEITLIEDCAQSLGTYTASTHIGNQGHFGVYSFFPAKNLGAFGDGGAVTTQDDEMYYELLKVKSHGYKKGEKYYSESVGGNFRLDTLQASLLNILITRLSTWLKARKDNANFYNDNIDNNNIIKPKNVAGHSWNQYTLIVDDSSRFADFMAMNGISTSVYYPHPLHINPVFKNKQKLKNAEDLCKKVISIPVYPGLTLEEMHYIVDKINEYR